jgi:hypothetical protein
VGNKAPEFKATAVFDQEFIDVSLAKYKGKYVVSRGGALAARSEHVCGFGVCVCVCVCVCVGRGSWRRDTRLGAAYCCARRAARVAR